MFQADILNIKIKRKKFLAQNGLLELQLKSNLVISATTSLSLKGKL